MRACEAAGDQHRGGNRDSGQEVPERCHGGALAGDVLEDGEPHNADEGQAQRAGQADVADQIGVTRPGAGGALLPEREGDEQADVNLP